MPLNFAPAVDVASPKECTWYQTFDWPDGTVVKGRWDYRSNVDDYIGRLDYQGKSVIEIGPASGYLTRAMEQRGADVTCIDLDPNKAWEIVPRLDRDAEAYFSERQRNIPKLRNSWWLSRQAFNGTAKMAECGATHLFELRDELKFDVGFVGSILQHFESPFRILSALAHMCETIVVTEPVHPRLEIPNRDIAEFLPKHANNHLGTWWLLSSSTVERMMGTLNFAKADDYRSTYRRYDFKTMAMEGDSFIDYPFYTHVYKKNPRNEASFRQINEF